MPQLVPADPPAFLQPLHAAFMRAGSQLRLLHSLERPGRQLAQQLGDVAEREARQRQRAGEGRGQAEEAEAAAGWHSTLSFSAAPAADAALAPDAAEEEEREPWLALAGSCPPKSSASGAAGALFAGVDLQLGSAGLQRAALISQECDAARATAVSGWLGQLALQRRLAEHAAVAEQLERVASQRGRQAEAAARQAAALSRRQSSKSHLFAEQQASVAERRARLAAQLAQQAAEDRRTQAQAALMHHSAAVAELEQALGQAAPAPERRQSQPQQQQEQPAQQEEAGPAPGPAAAAAGQGAESGGVPGAAGAGAPPAGAPQGAQQQPASLGLPPLKTRGSKQQRFQFEEASAHQQENGAPPAAPAAGAPAAGAAAAASRRPPLQPTALGWAPQRGLAAGAPAAAWEAQQEAGEGAEGDALVPLSAVLEASVTQSVLSQYRAVSRACVRWGSCLAGPALSAWVQDAIRLLGGLKP